MQILLLLTGKHLKRKRDRAIGHIKAKCYTWTCPTAGIHRQRKRLKSGAIISCFLFSSLRSLSASSTGCLFSSVSSPSRMAWTPFCGFLSLSREKHHRYRIWGLQMSQRKHSYILWPDSSLLRLRPKKKINDTEKRRPISFQQNYTLY